MPADALNLQESLAKRVREAGAVEPGARLAFETGGQRYLVKLDEAGEVLPLPPLTNVPLAKPWFLTWVLHTCWSR